MSRFQLAALGCAAVLVATIAGALWMCRYTIVVRHADGPLMAYELDRWTGDVRWLRNEETMYVRRTKRLEPE